MRDAARSLDDVLLAAATNPDGSRRFYPPYKHPATARLIDQKARLEAFPESKDRDAALDWTEEQLAAFEMGEDRAKRDYLRAHRGRQDGVAAFDPATAHTADTSEQALALATAWADGRRSWINVRSADTHERHLEVVAVLDAQEVVKWSALAVALAQIEALL